MESSGEYAPAYAQLGRVLMSRGDGLEEAEAHLRQALDLDPDYYWAHLYLGNLCRDEGRLEEAEVHFRRALEIEPESQEAALGLQAMYRLEQPIRVKPPAEVAALVEHEIARFRILPAVDALRGFLIQPTEEKRVCYDSTSVTVTVIARINPNVKIGYRHTPDIARWGLFFHDPEQPDTLGTENYWYLFLEDAFYNCPGWTGDLPPDYVIM